MIWISGAVPAVLVLGANNYAANLNSMLAADKKHAPFCAKGGDASSFHSFGVLVEQHFAFFFG
jgi:hypothetical protein